MFGKKKKNHNTISFLDTSAILNGYEIASTDYISSVVISELEHIKVGSTDAKLKYMARRTVRDILEKKPHIVYVEKNTIEEIFSRYPLLENKNDHRLICEAIYLSHNHKVQFYTCDVCLALMTETVYPDIKVTLFKKEEKGVTE